MPEFMEIAIDEAKAAALRNEVPVGAVLVKDDLMIARNGNRALELRDPTAHAEIMVIRESAKTLKNERLVRCDLYVTLEPCAMCAAAISFARIRRLYFGAEDRKSGAIENGVRYFNDTSCHHVPEYYGGIQAIESERILKKFFVGKRRQGQGRSYRSFIL